MKTLRVISLGAGVQSSTMLLMALEGVITPRPDCAIFADTQWEPQAVYSHLDYLEAIAAKSDFRIYRVSAGDIRNDFLEGSHDGSKRFVTLPFHLTKENGEGALGRRQCTREYKIAPIQKQLRHLLGLKYRQRVPAGTVVESWQGISVDEATRCRDSSEIWIKNVYPLVDRRMSRRDCLEWLKTHGYRTPPKSACLGCPFRSDASWRKIRENAEEWQNVIEFDRAIRSQHGLRAQAFLHSSRVPLEQVDFTTAEERGQINLFENDCESGVCGV